MAQRKKVPKPPAPAELLYCGWAIYGNTAKVFRRWRFEKDSPPLDARDGSLAIVVVVANGLVPASRALKSAQRFPEILERDDALSTANVL